MAKRDLAKQRELVDQSAFVGRVLMALVKMALTVMDEAPTTANNAERTGHARAVLSDPHRYSGLYAISVATVTFTGEDALDSEIIAAVRDAFNAHAGVTARDRTP